MTKKKQLFQEYPPDEVWKWKLLEEKFDQVLNLYNYNEIRLSILQDQAVLSKGIIALMQGGEAEQVSQRLINLCEPAAGYSLLSLRPEGTISVLHHTAKNLRSGEISRYYYHGPMFRKTREGNPLEFHQLGVELLGSDSLLSENEVISLGMRLLRDLGFQDVSLKLNSYGCENCRRKFFSDVRSLLDEQTANYCRHCHEELSANPFTETGCTDPQCRHDLQPGPQIGEYLCAKCKNNFLRIRRIQANLGHPYTIDPLLNKDFAYYNETVFDFVIQQDGRELTLGGGGRYDYLSAKITGRKIPAVGFYLDLDLILGTLNSRKLFLPLRKDFTVYICSQSPEMEMMILQIAQDLHAQKIKTVIGTDSQDQTTDLKCALGAGCDIVLILREENIREGKLLVHNLGKESQAYIALNNLGDAMEIYRKSLKK